MSVETVGLITANAALLVGAVWRMSAILAKMDSQLAHLMREREQREKDMKDDINALESRIRNLERLERRGGNR